MTADSIETASAIVFCRTRTEVDQLGGAVAEHHERGVHQYHPPLRVVVEDAAGNGQPHDQVVQGHGEGGSQIDGGIREHA